MKEKLHLSEAIKNLNIRFLEVTYASDRVTWKFENQSEADQVFELFKTTQQDCKKEKKEDGYFVKVRIT